MNDTQRQAAIITDKVFELFGKVLDESDGAIATAIGYISLDSSINEPFIKTIVSALQGLLDERATRYEVSYEAEELPDNSECAEVILLNRCLDAATNFEYFGIDNMVHVANELRKRADYAEKSAAATDARYPYDKPSDRTERDQLTAMATILEKQAEWENS